MCQQKSAIKFIKAIIYLAIIAQFACATSYAGGIAAQTDPVSQIYASIFKVSDYCGYGDGVLFSNSGLILTLREFALKPKSIRVWLDDSTKVEGTLAASDYRSNLAVIGINPELIEGLPVGIKLSKPSPLSASDTLYIFKWLNGIAVDTLKLLPVSDSLLLSTADFDENIAGNPIFDCNSGLFSIATSAFKNEAGDSSFISFADQRSIIGIIDKSRSSVKANDLPSPEKLPLPLPATYSVSQIKSRVYNPKKDTSLYFFKQSKKKQNFKVRIFTPPLFYHYFHMDTLVSGNDHGQLLIGKHPYNTINKNISQRLTYELFDNGSFSPVVIIVIEPILRKVSKREIYAEYGNYLGSYPEAKKQWHEQKALLEDFFLTVDNTQQPEIDKIFLRDIPVKTFIKTKSYFWSGTSTGQAFNGGSADYEIIEEVTAGILIVPYEVFTSAETKNSDIAVNVMSFDFPDKPDVIKIPLKTIEKIKDDFRFIEQPR